MAALTPILAILSASGAGLFFYWSLWFRYRQIRLSAGEKFRTSVSPAQFTVMVEQLLC